ncbi:MAG TPA: hypothetical protein VFX85_03330 [Solirubrobacterales bacterium]|nr:hypothetical protein [Solirubrobacterales bacterium]
MKEIRYAHIGLVMTIAFLVPSMLLFGDAGEPVVGTLGLVGFFLGLAVCIGLCDRNWRREQR